MTTEDELLILQQLVDSEGWKLYHQKFSDKFDTAIRYALDRTSAEDRDRLCERASAMQEMLEFPTKRITTLLTKLKAASSGGLPTEPQEKLPSHY